MAQFTHSLCEEVIRTEGACPSGGDPVLPFTLAESLRGLSNHHGSLAGNDREILKMAARELERLAPSSTPAPMSSEDAWEVLRSSEGHKGLRALLVGGPNEEEQAAHAEVVKASREALSAPSATRESK